MHKLIFYFIDEFKKKHLINLDKNISIIYRNYNKIYSENEVLEIKKFCLSTNRNLFISNNVYLANKFNLDGIYLPSFNKNFSILGKIDKRLKIIIKKKKSGDPPEVISQINILKKVLGYKPRYSSIQNIIGTSIKWERFIGKN